MTRKFYLPLVGLLLVASVMAVVFLRDKSVAVIEAKASTQSPIAQAEDPAPHEAGNAIVRRSTFAILNHSDIQPHQRVVIDETMRKLPPACRSALKNIYVRYDNSVARALGGTETIILNGNVPDDELRALFVHEFGHISDLGCLTGTPASGSSGFSDGPNTLYKDDPSVAFYRISWTSERVQKRGATSADFVSGYASWDAFEDFAETYAYYMLQRDAFEVRARTNEALRQKLEWMKTHIGGEAVAQGESDTDVIPWDVTLLPYEWQ